MANIHHIQPAIRQLPGSLRRDSPRPAEHRQPGYDERFDRHTVFSDAFLTRQGLELVGPPFLNVREALEGATFIVDGNPFDGEVLSVDKHRISRTILTGVANADEVVVDFPGEGSVSLPVNQPLGVFDGKRVLVTGQQNNPIEWIVFWARFHAVQHGVDAIVVYDNFSTQYELAELELALSGIPELMDVAVIDWRVPFGVTGGPQNMWDSDFGQHQQLEHAMRYVLTGAACVIQGDVDELVMVDGGSSICDMIIDSEVAEIRYPRRGIAATPLPGRASGLLSYNHADFGYFDPGRSVQMPKYAVIPSRVGDSAHYLVHGVEGVSRIIADDVFSRHYSGLRVDWRSGFLEPVGIDPHSVPSSSMEIDVSAVEQTRFINRLRPDVAANSGGLRPHLGVRSIVHPSQVRSENGRSRFSLALNNSTSLELLVDPKDSDRLVVSFHGALDRTKYTVPRFERLATIEQHEASGLYFSDPLLDLSPGLELAWFEGGEGLAIIESAVAVTKHVAAELGATQVVYSGSSGGGFAALQASALHEGSLALAFNPQTAIGKYLAGGESYASQRAYAASVWPEAHAAVQGRVEEIEDFESATSPRTSALVTYTTPRANKVLMGINVNDFHFDQHYLPFLGAAARGDNLARVSVFEYEGPHAHVPPTPQQFNEGLSRAFVLLQRLDRAPLVTERVAILGSCVTRDAFEFADSSWSLTKYMARSALASFCGRQTEADLPAYTNIDSTFQRRIVMEDVEKRGRRWLAESDFDWLIYDPIDERFTLADFEDGGVLTVSQEFTKLEVSPSRYRSTHFPSPEHFERWTAGWETFLKLLDGYGARDRLIVHRAKWVERVQGSDEPTLEPDVIARANEWLERAYERMGEDIPAEHFISVSEEHQVADPAHRWGISPFHYVEGYYREFLAKLSEATTTA